MSPTVLRQGGYQVKIYLNDHSPAHVHVSKGEKLARVTLQPVAAQNNWGFNERELSQVTALVQANQQLLLTAWDRYHTER